MGKMRSESRQRLEMTKCAVDYRDKHCCNNGALESGLKYTGRAEREQREKWSRIVRVEMYLQSWKKNFMCS